jgi:23S rRNA (uridine2552-2'-O)-methyltransferase
MRRSSSWMQSRRRDQYYRLAKEKGYRSRAAFKLSEIIRSYRIINRGDWVIELGAAPGGWTQVVAETIGNEGYVLGVDIQPVESLKQPQVGFMKLDITSDSAVKLLAERFPDKVDVVVSDVSPNVSGAWDLDHSRQIHLARRSLGIARSTLRSGGNFLVKAFQGGELKDFLSEVKSSFRSVRLIKPRATRASSSELYILGLGHLGES